MFSEQTREGWLEGYLLTGRHGFTHQDPGFLDVAPN